MIRLRTTKWERASLSALLLLAFQMPGLALAYTEVPYRERFIFSAASVAVPAVLETCLYALLFRWFLGVKDQLRLRTLFLSMCLLAIIAATVMTGYPGPSETIYYKYGVLVMSLLLPINYFLSAKSDPVVRRLIRSAILYAIGFVITDYLMMNLSGEFVSKIWR